VPGPHKSSFVIGHHVKTFNALEVKLIDKGYLAPVVNCQAAIENMGFVQHSVFSMASLVTKTVTLFNLWKSQHPILKS
jgi:hypothetical protein